MTSDPKRPGGAPLRVGVWGLGGHAERRLLPALARCQATTIAGLTSRDADRGARLAAIHDCPFWPRPEQLLGSDAIDVVLVATPIGCHLAHGRAVLEAGRDLWCEKSLTTSASEADELIAEARRRSLVLGECFMFLYHPHFLRLQAEATRIGELVSLTARLYIPRLAQPGFRHSRALGGGGLLDVGCYPVQAAGALLGDDLEVRHARLVQPAGSEVDMTGETVLVSPSGATALLEWGFGAAYRNDLTLCGTAGSIDADRAFSKTQEYEPNLVIRDASGTARVEPVERADSFVRMFDAFAEAHRDSALRERLYARAEAQARRLERVRVGAGPST